MISAIDRERIDTVLHGKEFRRIMRYAGEAVVKYRMITDGERILLGVSGGKDSLTLLHVLRQLQARAPIDFEIVAVTFDPQFSGFNSAVIQEYCNDLGVEHHVVSLDMRQILLEKSAEKHPRVLCSRLRRGMLYKTAQENGADKIALGHNLDDVAISFLISLFRGQGLTTMGPNVPGDGGLCRVIRPLIAVNEGWIRSVASALEYPDAGRCHYEQQLSEKGDRAYFGKLLASLEQRIPNVRRHILQSLGDVKGDYLLDLKFLTNLF